MNHGRAAWRKYGELIESGMQVMSRFKNTVTLGNRVDAAYAIQQIPAGAGAQHGTSRRAVMSSARSTRARFARPIFIVSSPRPAHAPAVRDPGAVAGCVFDRW